MSARSFCRDIYHLCFDSGKDMNLVMGPQSSTGKLIINIVLRLDLICGQRKLYCIVNIIQHV